MPDIAKLAEEARSILADWRRHPDECSAFYCTFERCKLADELNEREWNLLVAVSELDKHA